MTYSPGKKTFNKVFDKSEYLVLDPIIKINSSFKGSNLIFGNSDYDPKHSQLIYLGKVMENCSGKSYLSYDAWLDVEFPHVIYISGTRGSGKSFDLGVLIEGISNLEESTNIKNNIEPICSILIDTQSQFWTLKYKPNPTISANRTQLDDLKKWNISENRLESCKLWRVSQNDIITGDELHFQIKPSLVRHEEWCEILGIEIYGPQGFSLSQAIENNKNKNYSIEDLINYIRVPSNLPQIQSNSKASLTYKLQEYQDSGLFNTSGVDIKDLLIKGQSNVILLRDLRDIDKSLIVCVLARQIFTFMGAYHKEKKANKYFNKGIEKTGIPDIVWLVIDEAHVVAPNDLASPAKESLVEYVKRGRDSGLSLVLATQQPSAIDDRILSQVNISLTHRLAFQSDINSAMNRIPTKLIKKMKVSGIEINDFGDMLRYLDPGECFIGDNNSSRTVLLKVRPRITSHGGYAPR
jgi:uncharacterized protein